MAEEIRVNAGSSFEEGRRVNVAAERNMRMLRVNTNDVHMIVDIARQADRAINRIRKNLLIMFDPKDVIPLLERYTGVVKEFHKVTYDLCKFAGIEYRTPRRLQALLGSVVDEESREGVEEFKKERKADLIEEMLSSEENSEEKAE